MAKLINMPKMGNTVESVIVGKIMISVGDTISKGDLLFNYETDKSTAEYKAEEAGKVQAILMEEGVEIPVLVPVIVLGEDGEDISKFTKPKIETTKEESKQKQEPQVTKDVSNVVKPETIFGNKASPRAKVVAKELGINLSQVGGTGLEGRIQEGDVLAFYHAGAVISDDSSQTKTLIPEGAIRKEFTPIRFMIANTMMKSLFSGAQLTMGMEIDASDLFKTRQNIKTKFKKGESANSSINDLIIFALSRVLPKHPHLNALVGENYSDEFIIAHINVAINTPKGLLVPVVKDATNISLAEITKDTKEIIAKIPKGEFKATDMQGGTFTISNLGLSGVSFFTPVLNPPQAGLLGIGSPITRLKFNAQKEVVEFPSITLSLTMDHRPNDGVVGTLFLKDMKEALENISSLIK